jgi:hypothetical protein
MNHERPTTPSLPAEKERDTIIEEAGAAESRVSSAAEQQVEKSSAQHSEHNDYGLLDHAKYRDRMLPELIENKELDLNGNDLEIVREYLTKQDPAFVADLRLMIGGQKAMSMGVETVITIPSYQEGRNLEKTLRNYAKLNNRNGFEIVILENHPEGVKRDNSADIIDSVRKEFPDLNIVHLYKVFKEKPAIGGVRKYLVDAVLLRKSESNIEKSIVIVSNDADLEDISEDYANQLSAAFQKNKNVDAIEGKRDYPAETYRKYPLLHASQRLWNYLDIAFKKYHLKTEELTGTNSAFRSGIYAAIGGYNEKAQLAEDWELGQLIKEARGGDSERIKHLNSTWLISNPRRAVVTMLSGRNLIQQHEDFHVNEEVRKTSVEDLLREKRDLDEKEFTNEVQATYEHCARWKKSKGGSADDEYINKSFDRAMRFLGVNYEIVNDKVIISDIARLREGLRKYELKNS